IRTADPRNRRRRNHRRSTPVRRPRSRPRDCGHRTPRPGEDMMSQASDMQRPDPGMGIRLALDLGPIVVYFAAFALTHHNIYVATGLFMAVTAIAMVVSLVRFGKVSPIQIFSAVMVLVLGGLTIWLHKDWI